MGLSTNKHVEKLYYHPCGQEGPCKIYLIVKEVIIEACSTSMFFVFLEGNEGELLYLACIYEMHDKLNVHTNKNISSNISIRVLINASYSTTGFIHTIYVHIYIFVLLILTQPKFWTADKVGHRCRTCISSVTSFSASSGPTSRQSCRCRRPAAERSSGLAVVSWWLPHCHPSPSSSLPKKLLYAFQNIIKQECSDEQSGSDMEDPHACRPIPMPDLPNLHESSRVTLLLREGETDHWNFM